MGRRNPLAPRYVVQPKGRRNFVYRREIPAQLQPFIGRKNWVHAFRADTTPEEIASEAKRLATEHDALIARAEAGEVLDHKVIAEAKARSAPLLAGDKSALHEALGFLLDNLKGLQSKGTPDAYTAAVVNILENRGDYRPRTLTLATARAKRGLGARDEKPVDAAMKSFARFARDRDIRELTRDDVAAWIQDCRRAERKPKPLKPSAIKRRMQALHAIMAYALLDLDSGKANPFKVRPLAHLLKGGAAEITKRQPFNSDHLTRIDTYLAASTRLKDTKPILILLKHTGATPSEIGGLCLGDLSLDSDPPYIWIRRNALRDLKVRSDDSETVARDRIIPLVGAALDAAKDAYAKALRRMQGKNLDKAPLFRSFKPGTRAADSISQACNKVIRKALDPIKSERLVAYSFRHGLKQALRDSGATPDIADALMGHSGSTIAKNYGATFQGRVALRDALLKALPFLGRIDDINYRDSEKMTVEGVQR